MRESMEVMGLLYPNSFKSASGFDKCFVLEYNYVLNQELVKRLV